MLLKYPKSDQTDASDWSRFNCLNASLLSYWEKISVIIPKWQCLRSKGIVGYELDEPGVKTIRSKHALFPRACHGCACQTFPLTLLDHVTPRWSECFMQADKFIDSSAVADSLLA